MVRVYFWCLLGLLFAMQVAGSAIAQRPLQPPQPAGPPLPPPVPAPLEPVPIPSPPGADPNQDPAERPPTLEQMRARAAGTYKADISTYFQENCYRCHSDKKATAGLNLQALKPDFERPESLELWKRVVERLRYDEMPPRSLTPKPRELEAQARNMSELINSLIHGFESLRPDAFERLVVESLEIRAEDSRAVRLKKQHRNAAAEQLRLVIQQFQLGRITHDLVAASLLDLTNAEYALAPTKEERIAALQTAVDLHRRIESSVYSMWTAGVTDSGQLMGWKSRRLEAQVHLQMEIDRK